MLSWQVTITLKLSEGVDVLVSQVPQFLEVLFGVPLVRIVGVGGLVVIVRSKINPKIDGVFDRRRLLIVIASFVVVAAVLAADFKTKKFDFERANLFTTRASLCVVRLERHWAILRAGKVGRRVLI